MKKSINHLNRRDFIRNTAAGAASASMLNAFTQRALAAQTDFKRVIFWYVPEGCAQQAFWPAQTGNLVINNNASVNGKNPESKGSSVRGYIDASMAGYCLQPLQKHVNDISLYSGFQNRGGTADDPHKKVVQTALTGGTENQGSIDQILGSRMQGDSTISSIYTPVYGHHVLDRGAASDYLSPMRKIGGGVGGSANWNPMDTYNLLFKNGIPAPESGGNTGAGQFDDEYNMRLEMLKSAEARLNQVKCVGGSESHRKLEILLESFAKLEQDTQALLDAQNNGSGSTADVRFDLPNANWTNTQGGRTDNSKYWNQAGQFNNMVDVAINTTVAALALDRTRVSLMQFSGSGTNKGPVAGNHYTTVGIQGIEGGVQDHHLGHDPAQVRRRDQARVFRWYYGKLAYLIDRLKATPDGTGTLFDSTLIVTASEFGMYNHRNNDIPYMVAGGLGGSVKTGQYLNVSNGNNFKHSADFFLGVARALDVNLNSFGQSSNPFNLS